MYYSFPVSIPVNHSATCEKKSFHQVFYFDCWCFILALYLSFHKCALLKYMFQQYIMILIWDMVLGLASCYKGFWDM